MKKRWIVKKRKFPNILTQLLYNRGIRGKVRKKIFLEPDYERDLADPFLMRDMKKALYRIEKALETREKIGIFGDYDVDGICGSIVLYEFLERFGVTPFFEAYLPDRQKDGYGLNEGGLAYLKKQGVTLVITVDCGISNHKEIEWANAHGMDVIVTDHHEVSQGLPPAFAVINPKRKGETFPFAGLSGTGVAFKVAQALRRHFNHEKISEAWEKWLLDLVALATVADQMPLILENRALVTYGMFVLKKTKRLGLRELIRLAGMKPENIHAEDLLFQLAPRINAASRIDHAFKAFRLLTTKDREDARALGKEIDNANKKRQRLVAKAFEEIQARLAGKTEIIEKEKFILESSKNWQPGVCGLVANKILDIYGYPTFIISIGEDGAKGSARSLPPFSVVKAMKNAQHFLVDWGGHHQAGGLSILPKNLAAFREALQKEVAAYKGEAVLPSIEIDARLEAREISLAMYKEIERLEPFGKGNPEPIFLLKGCALSEVRKVGSDQNHFKLVIQKDTARFDAIYFRGVANGELKKGDIVDAAFTLKRSTWSTNPHVEMHIIDLKLKS